MGLRLFKYQGLGNDFVILDRLAEADDPARAFPTLSESLVRRLCDRHLGIGADGVLELTPEAGADARMVVHNADGSIAEMCGNGLRCAALHLTLSSRTTPLRPLSTVEASGSAEPAAPARSLRVQTGAGPLNARVRVSAGGHAGEVEAELGEASRSAAHLPSCDEADGGPSRGFIEGPLPGGLTGTAVSLGNPHLVIWDQPLSRLAQLGPALERWEAFPEGVNVELVEPPPGEARTPRPERDRPPLEVAVWERGVGATRACGTGAAAVAVAGVWTGRLSGDTWIPVRLPGGVLEIRVEGDGRRVSMRGPAERVYELTPSPAWIQGRSR